MLSQAISNTVSPYNCSACLYSCGDHPKCEPYLNNESLVNADVDTDADIEPDKDDYITEKFLYKKIN